MFFKKPISLSLFTEIHQKFQAYGNANAYNPRTTDRQPEKAY